MISEFTRLGLGLYQGPETDAADASLLRVMRRFVETGGSVIDCAPNYRNERSERLISKLISDYSDDKILISTKGGFVPFQFSNPDLNEIEFLKENYFSRGLINPKLFDQNYFQTFDPTYLDFRLQQTLVNMCRNYVDIYYLHNPEYLLARVGHEEFIKQMKVVFKWMREKIDQGIIHYVGISTWHGFFEEDAEKCLQIIDFIALANEYGLVERFQFIQFPLNLGTLSAFFAKTQFVNGRVVSLMRAIHDFKLKAVSSAPLDQGRLSALKLPSSISETFPGLTPPQASLAFVLSAPYIAFTLVGTTSVEHLDELYKVVHGGHYSEQHFLKILNS